MSVSFSYNLIGRGWSECTVVIDNKRAKVTASYLSDAFGDLLGAMIRMVEGQPEATASFAEEPGECRLRTFAGAVLSESQRLLQVHGAEGYLSKWVNNEFPIDKQERLRRLVRGTAV